MANTVLVSEVVVVGFGAAGAAAAIEAHDSGVSVRILEKMPADEAGGSTRVSGNVWFCPRDVETAVRYLNAQCGDYQIAPALVHAWATETARNTEWVRGLGAEVALMEFPFEYPELEGHECEDGFHHIAPAWGMGRLYEELRSAVEARGIPVCYETTVTELLRSGSDDSIIGVRTEPADGTLHYEASRAVVLATGGFVNCPEFVRTFLRLPDACHWGSSATTGDVLRMAQMIGAGLRNMHNYMGLLGLRAPGFASGFNIDFPADGWIVVDRAGRRFADERSSNKHGKIRVGNDYALFPDRPCFAIFDERTRLAGPLSPSIEQQGHGWNQRMANYRWSPDSSVELGKGWISAGSSIEDLATKLGIEPQGLAATVDAYNRNCAAGRDETYDRDPATLQPLAAPFYGFAWGPMLVFTCGGPAKNELAQVLDPKGKVIPRLYAAGEVASTYSYCMSGGQMIGDALAFGRIAGRTAANELLRPAPACGLAEAVS